jgi:iron complex transport system substrate-binding protein
MMSNTVRAGALIALACLITAPAAVAKRRQFPVTVHPANGPVTIKNKPHRIVVLSPSATETVFKIGAGSQVIAVDDQSDYPTRAPRTKLSSYRPNAEAVASYKPDLVITSTNANKLLPALKKLKIPTLYEPAPSHISGAYTQMAQIGAATGHGHAAAQLVRSMRKRIGLAVATIPSGPRVSFYHELSPDFYTATSRTFVGRVYGLFGLRNIADKASGDYPQLSDEFIIAANPQFIVLADTKCCHESARTVSRRTGWSNITAVKKHRVFALNDDIPSRWGPRIVNFVELIGRIVRQVRR